MYLTAQNEVQATINSEKKKFTEDDKVTKLMNANAQIKEFLAMNEEAYVQRFQK